MSGPLPAYGYLSSNDRTVSDMQTISEIINSVIKQLLGAAPEAPTQTITGNTITPPSGACVLPVDASGGGTIDTIQVTNLTDGATIYIHSVSSSDPITLANLATGSGVPIATLSGQNIVLTNPAVFVTLKYNQTLNQWQEMFPGPNWAVPGAIGATTPNTGAFTSLSLTTPLSIASGGTGQTTASAAFNALSPLTTLGDIIYASAANTSARLAGNTSNSKHFLTQTGTGTASAAPAWGGITSGDLPSSVVAGSGNLPPLFTTSISAQTINFSLSNASAGQIFGNFSGASGAPSYNEPGSADQVLGVAHTGGGLEYKTISAGTGLTSTPTTGSISLSLTTPVAVANGGTGASSLAGNGVVVMNSGGTAQSSVAPGASGNVLTSNGTSWASAPPSGGGGGSSFPDYVSYTYYGGL